MLHDLNLNNQQGEILGIAKIDITNDNVNISQKMINIDWFSFVSYQDLKDEEEQKKIEEKRLLQLKIERNIPPREYLFNDLLIKLKNIEVYCEFEGNLIEPSILGDSTTTTTTVAE